MSPENIKRLVDQYRDASGTDVEFFRQALLDAIEAALSKPAVPEDIGKLIDELQVKQSDYWMSKSATTLHERNEARRKLEAAIVALTDRVHYAEGTAQANIDRANEAEAALASAPVEPAHKRISAAIFDPGATEGLKGERTVTKWQTDAVMRVLSSLAPVEPAPAAPGWRSMDSAPTEGFFLAWSPDFPEIPMVWKAEIFHSARKPGTPKHLSANHFTLWMPCPLPTPDSNSTEGGEA